MGSAPRLQEGFRYELAGVMDPFRRHDCERSSAAPKSALDTRADHWLSASPASGSIDTPADSNPGRLSRRGARLPGKKTEAVRTGEGLRNHPPISIPRGLANPERTAT